MIETNRSDHIDCTIDHIGRVPLAAHADFDHADIDRILSKGHKGHGTDRFEE